MPCRASQRARPLDCAPQAPRQADAHSRRRSSNFLNKRASMRANVSRRHKTRRYKRAERGRSFEMRRVSPFERLRNVKLATSRRSARAHAARSARDWHGGGGGGGGGGDGGKQNARTRAEGVSDKRARARSRSFALTRSLSYRKRAHRCKSRKKVRASSRRRRWTQKNQASARRRRRFFKRRTQALLLL